VIFPDWVNALSSFQSFDTVGWVTGRSFCPQKSLCYLFSKILPGSKWRKKTKE